jgi:hypothetical protein
MIRFQYADRRSPSYVTAALPTQRHNCHRTEELNKNGVLFNHAGQYRTAVVAVAVATAIWATESQVQTHQTGLRPFGGATGLGGDWLALMDA